MKFSEYYSIPSRNGLSKKFELSDQGTRILDMKQLFGYNPVTDEVDMRQVVLTDSELKRFSLEEGDILFGRRSLVEEGAGKTTIYKGEKSTVFESSIIRVRLDKSKCDPDFVNYYFNSPLGRGQVLSIITGAAVFGIKGSDLKNLKVKFPDLPTQRKIASILSAYDDLIENNNQRIKLLEEMAEEIYKEWFVRLRFPGWKNTKFYDSDGKEVPHGTKGALPEGWDLRSINDLTEIVSGYAFKSSSFVEDGKYKLVTIKNVQNGEFISSTTDRIQEIPKNLKEDIHICDKDILLSLTGNIGRICLAYGDNYLLNQRVAKLKPRISQNFEFVYLFFRSEFLRKTLENHSNGAAQQNLSPIELGKLQFHFPSDFLLEKFSNLTSEFFNEVILLKRKNKLLRETRDLLLPRLISGKLDVEHINIDGESKINIAAEPEVNYE